MNAILNILGLERDSDSRTRHDLRPYQEWMVEKIKELPFLMLAAEPGLGKSVATLTALTEMDPSPWPVLIVAPLLVATDTWPPEIETWDHTRHLTYTVVTGTEDERNAALRKPAQIVIVNRENFVWLFNRWGAKWPYKIIVWDEASRLKGGKKRTKAGKGLKKDGTPKTGNKMSEFGAAMRVRPRLDRVIEMSGTPSPEGEHNLWGPITFLDQGVRLGKNKFAFENRWFNRNPWTHEITIRPGASEEITDRCKDIMFSLSEEDYLTLPPLLPRPIWLTFPPEIMKRYKAFERTLYDEGLDVEAVSQGVLVNKLLQFCSGSLYVGPDEAKPVHDLKFRAMDSLVEDLSGEPLLVAYGYRFDVDGILKRFPQARLIGDFKDWLKDWNAGKIEILVGHPASMGHGLNMQFGGSKGLIFGQQSSYELWKQFIKRIHRSGQKAAAVILYYILIRDTRDEFVYGDMAAKSAEQDRIMAAVKADIGS